MLLHRPIQTAAVALVSLAVTALTATVGAAAAAAAPRSAAPVFSALPYSQPATSDAVAGRYVSSLMSVQVVLAPSSRSGIRAELAAVYNPASPRFHHWLAKGEFARRFGPSPATVAAVIRYLTGSGLRVQPSGSSFLVDATGSSAVISAAFRTRLSDYVDPQGIRYFANSAPVRLPSSIAPAVLGVNGLSSTIRPRPMTERVPGTAALGARPRNCQTRYPGTRTLFRYFDKNKGFAFGYGGGPGCSGLTPAQDNSIYGAPHPSPRTTGAGVTMAVFELSAYRHSDIAAWAHHFYGTGYRPPLADVQVDGGPLAPSCPGGDMCPDAFNGYAGDIEVAADIEMQLAIAPAAAQVLVYNAPNDTTGQTELDEYARIANDDLADVVSSSWSVCEGDVTAGYVQAENIFLEQMALQGQSAFGAAGDSGAFSCLRTDGGTNVSVLDPPSQPWMTSVGGTSLTSDNPRGAKRPGYPGSRETVWNVDGLCSSKASADPAGNSGFFYCMNTGAGGGGSSKWWGRPFYQHGPGVANPYTTYGNGSSHCRIAAAGTTCREVPDLSVNADEFTPYAEYCTGDTSTPNSQCTFSSSQPARDWFGIGGTSLAAPFWSAIIADRDSYLGGRTGNVNPMAYQLLGSDPRKYFHDITGAGQFPASNGLFPVTSGYDEATGIGSPVIRSLITSRWG